SLVGGVQERQTPFVVLDRLAAVAALALNLRERVQEVRARVDREPGLELSDRVVKAIRLVERLSALRIPSGLRFHALRTGWLSDGPRARHAKQLPRENNRREAPSPT